MVAIIRQAILWGDVRKCNAHIRMIVFWRLEVVFGLFSLSQNLAAFISKIGKII